MKLSSCLRLGRVDRCETVGNFQGIQFENEIVGDYTDM
ncbi:hypothetical protein GGR95_001569 [Sulfitobacter undariae]|uniref:Uncharacterized protein n=1 Tax=Sulfitobacter undariae TaxID=1563671 RepID=A0A7W6E386_9RHOB|nr:hypothetical protein [Sulfitobacter undariae]